MSKIELPNVTGGYNLSTINNNFQKIEDALNKEVLYRKGYLGEPNEMQTNLDMNGKQILNVVTGTSPSDLATRGYVDEEVAEERVYVDQQLGLVNSELDTKYDKTGGPVFGDINLNGHKLIGASEVQTSKTSTSILEINGVPVVPGNSVIDPYNGTREALRRSYAEAGYNLVDGSFKAGGTITTATDVLLYEADGKAYSFSGILPHTVDGDSAPSDETGMWTDRSTAPNAFKQAGAGSVERTSQDKMRETLSPADKGAVAGGVIDATAAFQKCLDEAVAPAIDLDLCGNTYAITTVNIPNAKPVRVKNGRIIVKGAGSLGLSKRTTESPQSGGAFARYDLVCDNIQFERSESGGACVDIKLAWQDSTAGIVLTPSCNFDLKNGAVGVRASRSFFNRINGRFNMDATSVGFLADSSEIVPGDAYPSCPFITTFENGSFSGGIGFDNIRSSEPTIWNSFEGFTFTSGWTFYASQCFAAKYNFLQFNGTHMVSAKTVLDSGNNTVICGGYWDRQAGEGNVLTFKRTVRDVQQVAIGGGVQFNAQGTAGELIEFTDAGAFAGTVMTNINIDSILFIGGINDVAQRIDGIHFNDATVRNVNITGAQNFQSMYACLRFSKSINRSSIKAFEARDVSWYADGVAIGFGTPNTNLNRFDGVYNVYTLDIWVPNYIATAASEPIHKQLITFPNMMRPPVAVISGLTEPFGAGNFTLTAPVTYRNSVEIDLIKNASAPGNGRGGCGATLTLDASQYLAPL